MPSLLLVSPAAVVAAATTTKAANFNLISHCLYRQHLQPNCPPSHRVALRFSSNSTSNRVRAMAASETQRAPLRGKQALISLSDKRDLAFIANGLQALGYSIVSTGGTASALEEAGVSVTKVEEITHFLEMLDGRVKTLHPNVHGGILARRDIDHHMEALNKHGIGTFDVVVVNLYSFYEKVSSTTGISFEAGIENIDIGGPAMIRAAAKNHKDVLVVVDHQDYPALLEFLQGKQDGQQFRKELAAKAFQHVASYDSAVSEWLRTQSGGEKIPPSITLPILKKSTLRYGENPHQKAAFYYDRSLSVVNAGGIATAIQHHGKRGEASIALSPSTPLSGPFSARCEQNIFSPFLILSFPSSALGSRDFSCK